MRLSLKFTAPAFILILSLTLVSAIGKEEPSGKPAAVCRQMILENMDGMIGDLEAARSVVSEKGVSVKSIRQQVALYHHCRKLYKEAEFFIEYYSPFDAKFFINGPLVPKVDPEISSVPFEPRGFQVIEENLFDKEKTNPAILKNEYELLAAKFKALKEQYSSLHIENSKLQEALKLQLIRIMCLTLNGYDCTINKESIPETSYAIGGLLHILSAFEPSNKNASAETACRDLLDKLKACKKFLRKHKDSDSFDRLNFMTDYLNPAYVALFEFTTLTGVEASPINYAVNFKVSSFFNPNSINRQFFSVYIADTVNIGKQAALGQLLFYDPVLSGNNKRACASCHPADKAFADGLDKSLAFDGISKIDRNAPTLVNAAYQKLFFHDGRIFNLEEQANSVFKNSFEMSSSGAEITRKLKESDEYRQLFRDAFSGRYDTSITTYAIIKSITEFIKTLDSRNSRFDKYLRGDKKQLNAAEINGYNLFAGKALCGSCHFFPLFNGTVPPMFTDNEFEVIGVPDHENGKSIDADVGREKVTHAAVQKHAFKTPTLRNIELTAPYMHNGIYKHLDSVLVFYNRGGGAGTGLTIENQTLPFDSLGLSKKELGDLKSFLLTLTDVSDLPKPPQRLPWFNDARLNNRKTGGEY